MSVLRTNKIYPRDGLPAGASGGGIIQTVTVNDSTTTTISSTSYADTGLSASITPTSSSNKILIFVTVPAQIYRLALEPIGGLRLLRGATQIIEYPYAYTMEAAPSANSRVFFTYVFNSQYLDSPATTSSVTYKIQGKVYTTSNSNVLNYNSNSATSTITLVEVSG